MFFYGLKTFFLKNTLKYFLKLSSDYWEHYSQSRSTTIHLKSLSACVSPFVWQGKKNEVLLSRGAGWFSELCPMQGDEHCGRQCGFSLLTACPKHRSVTFAQWLYSWYKGFDLVFLSVPEHEVVPRLMLRRKHTGIQSLVCFPVEIFQSFSP